MWKTVGFLMSFAVVIEGMTVATFLILLSGGKQRRESGWKLLAILVGLAALVQLAAMALIVGGQSSSKDLLLTSNRRTYSITMTDSLQDGFWIGVGRCVRFLGAFRHFVQQRLPLPLWACPPKVDTS